MARSYVRPFRTMRPALRRTILTTRRPRSYPRRARLKAIRNVIRSTMLRRRLAVARRTWIRRKRNRFEFKKAFKYSSKLPKDLTDLITKYI